MVIGSCGQLSAWASDYGIRRFGDPADVAGTVAFLCSDRAGYIHGTTIAVDGGATPGI